jgi:hypothetical protein
MTHALADAVLVEHFKVSLVDHDEIGMDCPACHWGLDMHDLADTKTGCNSAATLGALLTAARRHISDAHPGGDPLSHEHAYTVALHAVDAINSDAYPALITEADLAADETTAALRVCEATGNSVRGPLLPYEADGTRRWICRLCFTRCRRNASHVADPLPMPDGAP